MRKLLKEYARTYPFQSLHNLAYFLMRAIRNQDVNMVARYFFRYYVNLMLHRYLPDQVAHTHSYFPCQYLPPVFRYPDQMNLQVILRVRTYSVLFHVTILHYYSLCLKARGFLDFPFFFMGFRPRPVDRYLVHGSVASHRMLRP